MKLRVRNDLVFIEPTEQPTMTADGLLHIVSDHLHSTMRGTVVALGDGPVTTKGVRLPHVCKCGDSVIFSPDSGSELMFERTKVIAMRETDILAVIGA